MEHGRKWSNFLKPSHRKGSALKAFLSTSCILDISLKKHQRSTFLNKKYLSHICWDFSLLGVCFTSSPAFQQCLIKNPVLLKLRSRINVKSWHSVINPLYMIRGEAGKKKTKVTSIHPYFCTLPTCFPLQNTPVHLPLIMRANLTTNKTICFWLYPSQK